MPNTSAVNMAANRRVELVVSVENPSDLPADAVEGAAVQDNVRHWLAKGHQTQGEGSWTEKR